MIEAAREVAPPLEPSRSRVRVELLRGFGLRHDGEPVELPLASQRVVAFLALQQRPVQRVFVAGTLFLDSAEERANARLRTALWRMRRPGCPVVSATSTHLSLTAGTSVDVRESRDRARHIVAGSSPPTDSDVYDLSASGELLPDWYDDWVLLQRERFRQLRLHALEALCRELAAAGRYAQATDAGLAAVEIEPLRESAHRVLIEAYLREGNTCDAIRQYRLFCDLLRRELGLAPSQRIRDLLRGHVRQVTAT
jgi:DNA-binding SARP family transcriptional activator